MNATNAPQNALAEFPIQVEWPERNWPSQIKSIPWGLIQAHEAQALKNHCGQSLARLAERHGLSAMEAVAILDDQEFHARWDWARNDFESRQARLTAIRILRERVKQFLSEHATKSVDGSSFPKPDSLTSTPSSSTREGAATLRDETPSASEQSTREGQMRP